jgi:hypothetical protein
MPDPASFGPAIAIGLVLVVMLWFTFGTQRNIRIGNDLLRWLQGGLPLLGSRTTLRWLGSSAVELTIAEAVAPFRDATVVVVLEPRDVSVLWAWARSRGRRDFVIVRANLRRAPRFSLAVADPVAWTGGLDRLSADDGWMPIEWPGERLAAAASDRADVGLGRDAWRRLEQATGGVWRLTIQSVVPHIEVHVLPPARHTSSDRLMSVIRDLGSELSAERRRN